MKMKITRFIVRNINLLNLGLLTAAAAAIILAALPLTADVVVPAMVDGAAKAAGGQAETAPASGQVPAYTDYAMIAEQNIFHSLRKIPSEKKGDEVLPRPELILYGTVITDSVKMAYVEDKKRPPAQPEQRKKQIVLKEGASLNNYVLKVIEKDRIEMVKGDDRVSFYLLDANKDRSRDTRNTMKPAAVAEKPAPPVAAKAAPMVPTRPRWVAPATKK